MNYQEQHLIDSLNKILSLQIDAIGHDTHVSIVQRKQMMDQLMALILSHRGKIDKRINFFHGPRITGEGDQKINDHLIELYRDIIEDDRISMGMKKTLSKHYELIRLDLPETIYSSGAE